MRSINRLLWVGVGFTSELTGIALWHHDSDLATGSILVGACLLMFALMTEIFLLTEKQTRRTFHKSEF